MRMDHSGWQHRPTFCFRQRRPGRSIVRSFVKRGALRDSRTTSIRLSGGKTGSAACAAEGISQGAALRLDGIELPHDARAGEVARVAVSRLDVLAGQRRGTAAGAVPEPHPLQRLRRSTACDHDDQCQRTHPAATSAARSCPDLCGLRIATAYEPIFAHQPGSFSNTPLAVPDRRPRGDRKVDAFQSTPTTIWYELPLARR